jgi:hypothetical protein
MNFRTVFAGWGLRGWVHCVVWRGEAGLVALETLLADGSTKG